MYNFYGVVAVGCGNIIDLYNYTCMTMYKDHNYIIIMHHHAKLSTISAPQSAHIHTHDLSDSQLSAAPKIIFSILTILRFESDAFLVVMALATASHNAFSTGATNSSAPDRAR
jgi:hypothetical protein